MYVMISSVQCAMLIDNIIRVGNFIYKTTFS